MIKTLICFSRLECVFWETVCGAALRLRMCKIELRTNELSTHLS